MKRHNLLVLATSLSLLTTSALKATNTEPTDAQKWAKLDAFIQVAEDFNTQGKHFEIQLDGKDPNDKYELENLYSLPITSAEVMERIAADGSFKPGLERVDVSLNVIKDKIMPSPSREELTKYTKHNLYLLEIYKLSCDWRLGNMKDAVLAETALKSLKWYMENYAPERPYWRTTMRFNFTNYPSGTAILGNLDRILLNLYPILDIPEFAQYRQLVYSTCDYADAMIELAIGAQNRGVNWAMRFPLIMSHFFTKYRIYGKTAIFQLKHHLQDGLEYDPGKNISGGMGTLADGGFWHHGRQPYCIPYGLGDFQDMMIIINWLEDTPAEVESHHLATYETQLLDKWQYILNHEEFFDLAISGGKQVARVVSYLCRVKEGTLLGLTNSLLAQDKDKLKRYDEIVALKQKLEAGDYFNHINVNKSYWVWEYMLHRRNGWYIGYRGLSDKVSSSEWDMGFHLSSGHSEIIQRGNEYRGVRPALTWTALAGITAEQINPKQIINKESDGISSFANGASDGEHGLFAFNMGHTNTTIGTVTAKKGGFFFDRGMVNLTTDVQRVAKGEGKSIWTSIDNRELVGEVVVNVDGKSKSLKLSDEPIYKSYTLTQDGWFWHDGIGYVVPASQEAPVNIVLKMENRKGMVSEYMKHNSADQTYSHDVLLIAINHGVNADAKSAIYYAYPQVTIAEMNKLTNQSPYEVVMNDRKAQVVYDKESGIVEFAVREAVSFHIPSYGLIEVTTPMVGLIKSENGSIKVTLADPNRAKSNLSIKIGEQVVTPKLSYPSPAHVGMSVTSHLTLD